MKTWLILGGIALIYLLVVALWRVTMRLRRRDHREESPDDDT